MFTDKELLPHDRRDLPKPQRPAAAPTLAPAKQHGHGTKVGEPVDRPEPPGRILGLFYIGDWYVSTAVVFAFSVASGSWTSLWS